MVVISDAVKGENISCPAIFEDVLFPVAAKHPYVFVMPAVYVGRLKET